MKCFGAAILQLNVVSTAMVMQAVKQAICPNTQFFNSLSLHPPAIVNELFQHYGGNKGKRGWDDQDKRDKLDFKDPRRIDRRNEAEGSADRVTKNPRQDGNSEQMRFTLPPSQLLLII